MPPLNGAMKLPSDDDDLDQFHDDQEALFASSNLNTQPASIPNPIVDCCVTSIASVQFLWIFRRLECVLGLVLLISIMLAITGVIETYEIKKHSFSKHRFSNQYADIKSSLELKLGDIDHWCLDGKDDTCPKCDDPTHPISRGENKDWREAFMRNVKLSGEYVRRSVQPDVIFLGDSLIEASVGSFKGLKDLEDTPAAQELDKIHAYYEKHLVKENGGKYDGLRLGIAGDTSPNVFWRIKQHEMRHLTPKVWWIAVGRNDLFRTNCSEEVALMGVLRIVEELVAKNDGATIVINSLLPTASKSTLQVEGKYAHNDMWKSIQEVNSRLKKFAQQNHHVVFYDANEVFMETRYKKKYISKKLYVDKVHPSYEGYKALLTDQLKYLDGIMEKRSKTQDQQVAGPTENDAGDNQEDGDNGEKKQSPIDTGDGDEYKNYDDYYGYENLFEDEDDIFNDFSLYDDVGDDW
jgi:lysophospholipase L1-like esterase